MEVEGSGVLVFVFVFEVNEGGIVGNLKLGLMRNTVVGGGTGLCENTVITRLC